MSLLTLPKGRASEPARSRVGSQGRATVITLQPPSRRALGPQIPCGSPSPRAGWWAHKTYLERISANSRNIVNPPGSLLSHPRYNYYNE